MKKLTIGTIAILIVVLMIISAIPVTISTRAADPNLVAYWKLDEGSGTTAADSSGNGNNGAISGATWTTGIDGSGLEFDGVNDHVLLPNLYYDTQTFSLWFKFNPITTHGSYALLERQYWSGSMSFLGYGLVVSSNGNLYFFVCSHAPKNFFSVRSTQSVNDNQWHHAVAIMHRTTSTSLTGYLYLDGELQESKTITVGNYNCWYRNLVLGDNWANFGEDHFNGTIDEVQIWNRALTSTEVKELYDKYALISATVNIDPDTLNLKSKGKWITGYIDFPSGYDVNDINISTVKLNDAVPADWGELQNTTQMVKFDRSDVEDLIGSPNDSVLLTVTGKIADGTTFEGNDTIRAIKPP